MRNCAASTIRLLVVCACWAATAAAAPRPIVVRFTASDSFVETDHLISRPLDSRRSKSGFDIVFRTSYDDRTLFLQPLGTGEMLAFSGSTSHIESNPSFQCQGTLTFDPTRPPSVRTDQISQSGPIKTLRIFLPHIMNNGGTVGMLSDPSQPLQCRTPFAINFVGGSGVQQTYEWVPLGQYLLQDVDPTEAGNIRGSESVVQFDIRTIPLQIPLRYLRRSTVFGAGAGAPTNDQEHFWFGQIEVFPDTGASITPRDPDALIPAAQPTNVPAVPTATPKPTTPNQWNSWLPDVVDTLRTHLVGLVKRWQSIITGTPQAFVTGSTVQYDVPTSTAAIAGLPPPPGSALLEIQVTTRDPKKAKGFKPVITASATRVHIDGGAPLNLAILFDTAIKRAFGKAAARTVFILVRATPDDGSGVFERTATFKKAMRRRPRR